MSSRRLASEFWLELGSVRILPFRAAVDFDEGIGDLPVTCTADLETDHSVSI
jgi:hypothetical protein